MGYGKARDMSELWDCVACEDEGNVVAECVVCGGSGEVVISVEEDMTVCWECGGTGRVSIPCPRCSNEHTRADVAEQEAKERAEA